MPARRIAASRTVLAVAPAVFSTTARTTLFAAIALGTLATSACSRSRSRRNDPNAFAWNGPVAAPATVQVRNTVGSITVEPSPDKAMHVTAATSWTRGDPTKDVKFQVVTAGTTVTVCAIWNNGGCSADDYSSGKRKRGITFGWSTRSDASVAFTVQVPAGVKVDAATIEGSVNVRASAPVKARTIDGSLKVGTSIGPVDAETMNGDVDVRMTTIGDAGDVRAVTKNGTAVAWVPEIADGRIDASTLNGELGTDFGAATGDQVGHIREFKSTVGAGSRAYDVQTLNGSAWLRLISADGTVGSAETGTPAKTSAAPSAKSAKRTAASKRNQ